MRPVIPPVSSTPTKEQRAARIASRRAGARPAGAGKYVATLVGLGLAVAFVVVFFAGRGGGEPLGRVASRVGWSYDELMAMGPRIAANTGVTLGTSRHIVYLLACSGLTDKDAFEARATDASRLAYDRRLSDREAVLEVLAQTHPRAAGADNLKAC